MITTVQDGHVSEVGVHHDDELYQMKRYPVNDFVWNLQVRFTTFRMVILTELQQVFTQEVTAMKVRS